MSSLNENIIKIHPNLETLIASYNVSDKSALDFAQGIKDGSIILKDSQSVLDGYQSYLQTLPGAFNKANVSAKTLSASMKILSSIGWAAVITGISWLISKGIDTIVNADERAKQALENAQLAQGVNTTTNENLKLTNEEYEEFLDLSNQLAELFPSLTRTYDDNNNAILGLGGSVENITGKISELAYQQERLSKIEMLKNLESYVNGDKENGGQLAVIDGLDKNLTDAENALDMIKVPKSIVLIFQKQTNINESCFLLRLTNIRFSKCFAVNIQN